MAVPSVAGVVATTKFTTERSGDGGNDLTLPTAIASGELLVLVVAYENDATPATISGWSREVFADDANYTNLVIFERVADGTEGSTVNLAFGTNNRAAISYGFRLQDVDTAQARVYASAQGQSSSGDPPSAAYGWSGDTLAMAVGGVDDANISGAPSGYANIVDDNNSKAHAAIWSRSVTASPEDPGTFSIASSRRWKSATILVKGTSASGITASVDASYAAQVQAASASVDIVAAVSSVSGEQIQSADAAVGISVDAATTHGGQVLAASGALDLVTELTATYGPVSLTASATLGSGAINAQLAAEHGGQAQSAAASLDVIGQANIALDELLQSATAVLPVVAGLGAIYDDLGQDATALIDAGILADLDANHGAQQQTASAFTTISASVVQPFDGIGLNAGAQVRVAVAAAQGFDPLSSQAGGGISVGADADQFLDPVALTAAVTIGDPPAFTYHAGDSRPIVPGRDPQAITLPREFRSAVLPIEARFASLPRERRTANVD